jgi:Tfp pilus assembly PilM family ATPase
MMVRKGRKSVVGVEITDREIRSVYVRYVNARPQVVACDVTPIEKGQVTNGRVGGAVAVGLQIRQILTKMKADSSAQVAFSLPTAHTRTYRISVPDVGGNELDAIVDGEVAHYQIVTPTSCYGYMRLRKVQAANGQSEVPIVVAVSDRHIVDEYREIAEHNGLHVAAIEAAQAARIRAYVATLDRDAGVLLLVNETSSDLVVFSNREVVFMRPLEYGVAQLTTESVSGSYDLNDGKVDELSKDLRRTIDYIEREYAPTTLPKKLYLCSVQMQVQELLDQVAVRLDLELRWAGAYAAWLGEEGTAAANSDSLVEPLRPIVPMDGIVAPEVFATAYGIAINDRLDILPVAPRLDLYRYDERLDQERDEKRNLAGSIVVSIVALLVGAAGFVVGQNQVSELTRQTVEANLRADNIRKEMTVALEQSQSLRGQLKMLERLGLPVVSVIDDIAKGTPPNVGITEVDLQDSKAVIIRGEANVNASVVQTIRQLQKAAAVQVPTIIQQERVQRETSEVVMFSIAARTYALDAVRFQGRPSSDEIGMPSPDEVEASTVKLPPEVQP